MWRRWTRRAARGYRPVKGEEEEEGGDLPCPPPYTPPRPPQAPEVTRVRREAGNSGLADFINEHERIKKENAELKKERVDHAGQLSAAKIQIAKWQAEAYAARSRAEEHMREAYRETRHKQQYKDAYHDELRCTTENEVLGAWVRDTLRRSPYGALIRY